MFRNYLIMFKHASELSFFEQTVCKFGCVNVHIEE